MAFADGNKYARMSDDELDDVFGHFKNVIDKDPERAIAMLIVPTLTSARRQKGDRDERARIERKADAKFLTAWLCQLYMSMSETHGNDTKQRSYNVYILWTDDEEEAAKNPFLNSYMVHRRGTMQDAQWIDPSAVYVPMSQPGSAVAVTELGQEKRAAQLLGGHDVARCLVQATLTNKNNKPLLKPADVCIWSHWTPLDACIELVVRQEAMKPDMPNMHTFSASNVASDALACQARLMSTFLKDWKWNKQEYIIGEALQYSEELPEAKKKEIGNIDAEPPKLRLCSWITENGQECLSLPDGVRNKWMEHPMYGEQWRLAITAFLKATKTLLTPMSRPAPVAPPAGGEDDTSEGGEWATMSEKAIRAQNEIQKEFPTDFPNIVYLLSSHKKLFAVARDADGTISSNKHVFHHGVGDWTKPPNAEKLLTKDTEDKCQTFCILVDDDQCVLEIVPEGGRAAEDTDASTWGDFLRDLESNGMGEAKIFGHKYSRPEGAMNTADDDHFILECTLNTNTHWVWKPRAVDIAKATFANVANVFPIEQLLDGKAKVGPKDVDC